MKRTMKGAPNLVEKRGRTIFEKELLAEVDEDLDSTNQRISEIDARLYEIAHLDYAQSKALTEVRKGLGEKLVTLHGQKARVLAGNRIEVELERRGVSPNAPVTLAMFHLWAEQLVPVIKDYVQKEIQQASKKRGGKS